MTLFLDANAHLPINQKALNTIVQLNNSAAGHGNAMATSIIGRKAASEIENAREKIAQLIGAKNANQIVFTSTCSQGCEWGLTLLKAKNHSQVFQSTIEHSAVARKASELFGNKSNLIVNKNGMVNCTFNPGQNTAMVCIHVHNEIGTIQPIEQVKVDLFSDMSQSLGKIPVNVSSIPNLKIATFGAHKFGGPVGVGFMYIQDTDWWKEFGSGSRYYFDRTGTPDALMISATAIALEEALKTLRERYEKAIMFRNIIENGVEELGLQVVAKDGVRVPHTSFIKVGKRAGPFLLSSLETDDIVIGLGSACGALNAASSPIASAIGLNGLAHDFIRVSQWGNYGEVEAKKLISALKRYCARIS